jgi:tetratricopeptide (TPR) repeat protein
MMKIKPVYIYGILALGALFVLLFLTNQGSDEPGLSGNKMPQDDVHKQFNDTPPGKGNVSGEFYAELEKLRKDVEKDPNDTAKIKAYADYLTAAHQFDGAIPLYEEILDKNPRRTDIYFSLTFVYYNMKELDKAEEMTNRVLSYDKNNLQARYNLGAITAAKGDESTAKDIWNKLVKEYPSSREAGLAKDGLAKLK